MGGTGLLLANTSGEARAALVERRRGQRETAPAVLEGRGAVALRRWDPALDPRVAVTPYAC